MRTRNGVMQSWKLPIVAMAVFLLLLALPGGAYADETLGAGSIAKAPAATDTVEAPGGTVTDGESFAAALGGQVTYTMVDGVCVVELTGDVAMKDVAVLNAGSYKLTGDVTISRAEKHKGLLFRVSEGTSLEIAGSVVLDGGAVWTKDDTPVDSAIGASNSGIVTTTSLIDNIRGNVVISENAMLCNNDSYAALYVEHGTVSVKGGSIYANRATSNYGGAIHVNYGTVEMSGGDVWGNVGGSSASASAICGYTSSTVRITGGSVHDNAGPVAVSANTLEVTGGTFTNNLGSALGRCSSSATISGGTFNGNVGGAFANSLTSTVRLKLGGSPDFKTEADALVTAKVELVDNLGDNVRVCMKLNQYWMGDLVLFGDAALLEAYHSRFSLAYEDDDDLAVNASGRIDTNPSSFVHKGEDLVAVFGGEDFATSSLDEETGVYTVTLKDNVNVKLPRMTYIESGSYVLTGKGTISRADGYTGALLKIVTGASLEITGSVVIDGGAAWTKDGASVDSAVGASNGGVVSTMALVDNYGGALKISGNVILCNNSNNCAVYCDNGTLEITGGQIYGISSTDGGGAVKTVSSSNITVSGGEFWGNAVTSGARGSVIDAENSTLTVTGGTFRENSGPAAVVARNLTVEGGTFINNQGAALGTCNTNSVKLSGGTFNGNAGGAFACTYGTATLQLSGSPVFVTEADEMVRSTVQLTGELDESVHVRLQPSSYTLGDTVVTGSEELIAAYISQFTLVSDNGDLVINADGRIDTATTSLVTNGDALAAALGGAGVATSSRDEETGVYTVTLMGDVALSHQILIEEGSYVLTSTGTVTISRTGGYQGVLLKNVTGTTLEITGSIVIDGGAVWEGGEKEGSAVNATNTGVPSTMALVDNYGGVLKISGNAILRNNDGNCAAYCDNGTLEITGGQIYGIRSKDGGGAVRTVKNSVVTISGGEFWGNVVTTSSARGSAVDGENSTVTVTGGTFSDSSGPAAVAARTLSVEGGTFTNNQGAALGTRSSNSVALSGGTFNGNAGGAFACTNGTVTLQLEGSPAFVTDADEIVHSTVQLTGDLGDRVMVRIQLDSYEPGQKVLTGDAALIAAYHSRFSLVGADGEYVVSADGEIDDNPAESVSDGNAFAAALGGEGIAASSLDAETGVYTITLSHGIALSRAIEVTSGSYVLAGQGIISRAGGYNAALFQIAADASLTITDEVILDGGAVWMKDGARVESAVGAANEGAKSVMALVSSYGGNFVLSGNAALRNNDGSPALYASQGSLRIEGGSIYGNHRAGYGAAVDFSQVTLDMTGGSIWGNVGEGLGAIIRGGTEASPVQISGVAEVSGNEGPVAVAGSDVAVSGGTFSDNSGAVLGVHESGSASVSGGTFSNNPGGVFTSEGEATSLQLSGAPAFETPDDATVHATVELAGELGEGVQARIQLDSYLIGDQVLFGDEALVKAYYQCFALVSDEGFVVDSIGRVDTDPTSFVNDGNAFAAALGGAGVATSSYDTATGTYTITLSHDVELTHAIILESGSYVLAGSGVISRGGEYTNLMLKVGEAASLEISGNVVLDGGAVWLKDGEPIESVTEAGDWSSVTIEGVKAAAPLVFSNGGDFTLSGNAVLRYNNEYPAMWSSGGAITIAGGSIYGNCADEAAGVYFSDASLVMTGGDIWGNCAEGILYGDIPGCSITISGGSLHDNWDFAAALADTVTVAGGTFSNNNEFAVAGRFVAISGGTFSGNYGAVYTYDEGKPGIIQLSGAPVFDGEYDVLFGLVEVAGELSGSDVFLYPEFASDEDSVVVRSAGSYDLTTADVAKFSLFGPIIPEGYYLDFDPENNQIVLAQATPVLLEVTAVGDVEFDDTAIEFGVDFDVKVFEYINGVKGSEITADYAIGGGSVPVTYRYRSVGSTAYEMGLPSDPGTYEVQAITAAYKAGGYASGTTQFTLTITGGFSVTFHDGQGNAIFTDWVVSGAAAKAPANPVREGFTFKGWDVDFSSVTSNLDVTALWEEAASPDGDDPSVGPGPVEPSVKPTPNPESATSKVANPMVVKSKKAKKAVKVSVFKLQEKAVKIARKKAIAVSNAKGAVTYKLKSVKKAKFKKYFKVAKKTGKITVKKGLKKGVYRLRIAVTAAGDAGYESATKVVTVKVRVA